MAITGTHTLLYSSEPEKLREILRDVFSLPNIDIGGGWMIFALPPSEIAVHPADGPTFESGVRHQFTLMCDNIGKTISELKAKGIEVMDEPQKERWGTHVTLNLPGNCHVMVYEPHHPIAAGMTIGKKAKSAAKKRSAPTANRAPARRPRARNAARRH